MNTEINKIIDQYLNEYQKAICKKYKNVNNNILKKLWIDICSNKNSETPKKKKKSAYQNFYSITRTEISEKNPELTFGNISTMIAERWKILSDNEKKEFENIEGKQKEKNETIEFSMEEDNIENRADFEDDYDIEEDEDEEEVDEEDEFTFDD